MPIGGSCAAKIREQNVTSNDPFATLDTFCVMIKLIFPSKQSCSNRPYSGAVSMCGAVDPSSI